MNVDHSIEGPNFEDDLKKIIIGRSDIYVYMEDEQENVRFPQIL
jgi:hypothetical protein